MEPSERPARSRDAFQVLMGSSRLLQKAKQGAAPKRTAPKALQGPGTASASQQTKTSQGNIINSTLPATPVQPAASQQVSSSTFTACEPSIPQQPTETAVACSTLEISPIECYPDGRNYIRSAHAAAQCSSSYSPSQVHQEGLIHGRLPTLRLGEEPITKYPPQTLVEEEDLHCIERPQKKMKFPPARQRQQYNHLLVIDIEATCNKQRTLAPVEVIELSCVVVDAHALEVLGEFQSYVQPTEHPVLDPFCVELTGIQQWQVDNAPPLGHVLCQLQDWLERLGALGSCLSCTWTDWDLKVCLEMECSWRQLPKPAYLRRWCDLKKVFVGKYRRGGNLRSCVELAGLCWEGRAHSGLDDARNTARLAMHLICNGGAKLGITGQFVDEQGSSKQGQTLMASTGVPDAAKLKQTVLAPHRSQSTAGSDGEWNGNCKCGVKASLRTTKKPGPNHGRQFHSCGRWTITRQVRECNFFLWVDQQ